MPGRALVPVEVCGNALERWYPGRGAQGLGGMLIGSPRLHLVVVGRLRLGGGVVVGVEGLGHGSVPGQVTHPNEQPAPERLGLADMGVVEPAGQDQAGAGPIQPTESRPAQRVLGQLAASGLGDHRAKDPAEIGLNEGTAARGPHGPGRHACGISCGIEARRGVESVVDDGALGIERLAGGPAEQQAGGGVQSTGSGQVRRGLGPMDELGLERGA